MKLPAPAKTVIKNIGDELVGDKPTADNSTVAPTPDRFNPAVFADTADGGMIMSVYLDPDVAKRLRSRADTRNLALFVWETILRPAIMGSAY